MPGRRMPFTASQVTAIVDGAARAGKIHPRNHDAWLVKVAAGGPQAGQAITDLLAMVPADPVTRARWAREHPRAAGQVPAEPSEDDVYAAMYPPYPHTPVAGREPDRLGQADMRHAWLTSQAAAGDAGGGELIDHGRTTVTEHEHLHADHQGGYHTHGHGHAGDANHTPGVNHLHQLANADPAAAGIAAARAARIRTNPGDVAAGATDDQLFDRLFGRPAGQ